MFTNTIYYLTTYPRWEVYIIIIIIIIFFFLFFFGPDKPVYCTRRGLTPQAGEARSVSLQYYYVNHPAPFLHCCLLNV